MMNKSWDSLESIGDIDKQIELFPTFLTLVIRKKTNAD